MLGLDLPNRTANPTICMFIQTIQKGDAFSENKGTTKLWPIFPSDFLGASHPPNREPTSGASVSGMAWNKARAPCQCAPSLQAPSVALKPRPRSESKARSSVGSYVGCFSFEPDPTSCEDESMVILDFVQRNVRRDHWQSAVHIHPRFKPASSQFPGCSATICLNTVGHSWSRAQNTTATRELQGTCHKPSIANE